MSLSVRKLNCPKIGIVSSLYNAKNVDAVPRNSSHLNLCCVNFIKLKSVRRFAIGKKLKRERESGKIGRKKESILCDVSRAFCVMCIHHRHHHWIFLYSPKKLTHKDPLLGHRPFLLWHVFFLFFFPSKREKEREGETPNANSIEMKKKRSRNLFKQQKAAEKESSYESSRERASEKKVNWSLILNSHIK